MAVFCASKGPLYMGTDRSTRRSQELPGNVVGRHIVVQEKRRLTVNCSKRRIGAGPVLMDADVIPHRCIVPAKSIIMRDVIQRRPNTAWQNRLDIYCVGIDHNYMTR